MALARDVPFMQYGTDEITTTAAGTCNNDYFRATPHLTALLRPYFLATKYEEDEIARPISFG